MPNLDYFNAPTIDESCVQIAGSIPQGRGWNKKTDPESNIFGLIRSLAHGINLVQQRIQLLVDEFNINNTFDLLTDWETSVGIPDDCLKDLDSLIQRRSAIISRLRKIPVVTKEEFEALAFELIGETAVVTDGWSYDRANNFPDAYSRFKMYVQFVDSITGFPYSFPYPFGRLRNDLVECVFNAVKPANVVVIFV